MILANGITYASEKTDEVLAGIEAQLCHTLSRSPLDPMVVIEACDALSKRIKNGGYDTLIRELAAAGTLLPGQLEDVLLHMSRESLVFKLKTELGEAPDNVAPPYHTGARRKRMPLGVLLHIAAGNMDALPAYSVVEGLLAGNINLLKLPGADNGLSLLLLSELVKCEPRLSPYIYVFDTPSTDVETLSALAQLSDGISVWGGDEAVSAFRRLAHPGAKLIEWGHKLSFAYVTPHGASDEAFEALAAHIFETNQVLCSSCQGVFVDTDDISVLESLANRLFDAMESTGETKERVPDAMRAKLTLNLRCIELEGERDERRLLRGRHASVLLGRDSEPEGSLMFGSCWVKPLKREKIVEALFPHRRYMQTVGVICADSERAQLHESFARAGAVRITGPQNMSRTFPGEAHDGEYPLLRYSKIVEADK